MLALIKVKGDVKRLVLHAFHSKNCLTSASYALVDCPFVLQAADFSLDESDFAYSVELSSS